MKKNGAGLRGLAVAHRLVVSSILAWACLLSACGGGGSDNAATGENPLFAGPPDNIVRSSDRSAANKLPSGLVEIQLIKSIERQISRTVFEYEFAVTVTAHADPVPSRFLVASSAMAAVQIVSGNLVMADLAAGQQLRVQDRVVLRHDRTAPFDPEAIDWQLAQVVVPQTGFAPNYLGSVPMRITTDAQPYTVARRLGSDQLVTSARDGLAFVRGELVVLAQGAEGARLLSDHVAARGFTVVARGGSAVGSYTVQTHTRNEADLLAVRDDLAAQAFVYAVSKNYAMGSAAQSGDPSWQTSNQSWNLDAIRLAAARDLFNNAAPGNGVRVGVLDAAFPDIASSLLPGRTLNADLPPVRDISLRPESSNGWYYSFLSALVGPSYFDVLRPGETIVAGVRGSLGSVDYNHGAHVLGIIAALDDAKGTVGVAPGASLTVADYLALNEIGALDQMLHDMERLVEDGNQVINLSVGTKLCGTGAGACPLVSGNVFDEGIARVHLRALDSLIERYPRTLFIQSAGNQGQSRFEGTGQPVWADLNGFVASWLRRCRLWKPLARSAKRSSASQLTHWSSEAWSIPALACSCRPRPACHRAATLPPR